MRPRDLVGDCKNDHEKEGKYVSGRGTAISDDNSPQPAKGRLDSGVSD